MANFLKSFFGGKTEDPQAEKEKNDKKNFEILTDFVRNEWGN